MKTRQQVMKSYLINTIALALVIVGFLWGNKLTDIEI